MSQSLTSFADLLRAAETSAVHLEMRDSYGVENEIEGFAAWRKGHRLNPDDRASWWRPWLDLVQEVTSKGVVMRRARIVSEPASEYIRAVPWLRSRTSSQHHATPSPCTWSGASSTATGCAVSTNRPSPSTNEPVTSAYTPRTLWLNPTSHSV